MKLTTTDNRHNPVHRLIWPERLRGEIDLRQGPRQFSRWWHPLVGWRVRADRSAYDNQLSPASDLGVARG